MYQAVSQFNMLSINYLLLIMSVFLRKESLCQFHPISTRAVTHHWSNSSFSSGRTGLRIGDDMDKMIMAPPRKINEKLGVRDGAWWSLPIPPVGADGMPETPQQQTPKTMGSTAEPETEKPPATKEAVEVATKSVVESSTQTAATEIAPNAAPSAPPTVAPSAPPPETRTQASVKEKVTEKLPTQTTLPIIKDHTKLVAPSPQHPKMAPNLKVVPASPSLQKTPNMDSLKSHPPAPRVNEPPKEKKVNVAGAPGRVNPKQQVQPRTQTGQHPNVKPKVNPSPKMTPMNKMGARGKPNLVEPLDSQVDENKLSKRMDRDVDTVRQEDTNWNSSGHPPSMSEYNQVKNWMPSRQKEQQREQQNSRITSSHIPGDIVVIS